MTPEGQSGITDVFVNFGQTYLLWNYMESRLTWLNWLEATLAFHQIQTPRTLIKSTGNCQRTKLACPLWTAHPIVQTDVHILCPQFVYLSVLTYGSELWADTFRTESSRSSLWHLQLRWAWMTLADGWRDLSVWLSVKAASCMRWCRFKV